MANAIPASDRSETIAPGSNTGRIAPEDACAIIGTSVIVCLTASKRSDKKKYVSGVTQYPLTPDPVSRENRMAGTLSLARRYRSADGSSFLSVGIAFGLTA